MGNHLFYSSEKWQKLRQDALRRSPECERCGSKVELTVHHKNYHRFGGNELPEDLEVLCWECHQDNHETEEKFWVNLVNSIESVEQGSDGKEELGLPCMKSAGYLGIKDKDSYLEQLYIDLSKRKESFGSSEYIGIHECHLCCNNLEKYPYCKKPRKYGCFPLK